MHKYYDENLNVIETELGYSKKHDLYYRPNTSDLEMIKEGIGDYPTLDFKDKIVFDCGANIGSFTARALRGGATAVYSYEPEEFNFGVLETNTEHIAASVSGNHLLIKAALVAGYEDSVTFYMGKSKNSACSGSTTASKRTEKRKLKIDVSAINFYGEVNRYQPELIKLDIEGGEYGILLDYQFPDFVEEIAVELHGMSKDTNRLMYILDEQLKKQFPVIHHHEVCEVFQQPALILGHYARV